MFDGRMVSFYTPDYEKYVKRFQDQCDQLGLRCTLFKRDKLEGGWSTTTSLMAEVMHTAMKMYDESLMWLDIDAGLLKIPEVLDDVDVMAKDNPSTTIHRPWTVAAAYVNNTRGGRDFLARWKENSIWLNNALCTDHYFFNRTCREMGSKLNIQPLDTEFFKVVRSGNVNKTHKDNMGLRSVKAWWPQTPKPGNFGDMLTPYMIELELGKPPKYAPASKGTIQGAGSTLRLARGGVVWGSGIMHYGDDIRKDNKLIAVRGPVSQRRCKELKIKPPSVIGDPGLLLPMFYDKPMPMAYPVGIVPHYVNYKTVVEMFKSYNDVLVINPIRAKVTDVVDEIRSCEKIYSSSLHGLIEAHAYGVPYAWVKFKEPLNTDGSKFHDFFESVGIDYNTYDPVCVNEAIDMKEGVFINPSDHKGTEDFRALWDVCPFRLDNR